LNIHDLARHLNVSIGTVSRALNGRADVNAKTRERVIEAARRLGYSPNQSGRSLRQGSTGLVGFMVITNREQETKGEAFFMQVFDGMQSYFYEHGFDLVVHFCGSYEDPLAHLRRNVERRLVDGIVISQTSRADPRIDYLVQRKVPFVAFGRSENTKAHSWIDLDFEGVAERAIDHLTKLGHTNIAIASSSNDVNYGHLFVRACRAALETRGLGLPEQNILRESLTEAGGYKIGERLLTLSRRPSAIVLVNNIMAIGLYHKLQDVGLVPGRDIAVVGFDETPTRDFLKPSLTQFRISLTELGSWLAGQMSDMLEAKASGKRWKHFAKIWPLEMTIGDSSGTPGEYR
jgi:DNA-binding LacI/PurR family transcriptional regulator